jgi:hypothetical protein
MLNGNFHFRRRMVPWFVAAVVAAAYVAFADAPAVVRIEEDWELAIGTPSPESDAPQVVCLISPFADTKSYHATFVVNYHENPSYAAGGLQLQTWNGKAPLQSKRAPNQAVLSTTGETIRWTQVMRRTSDGLIFEVLGGSSTTWGAFGNDGSLQAAVGSSPIDLSGYSPALSVKESGVSYGGNRVRSLVLKRIRVYGSSGLLAEDDNPRTVYGTAQ